MATVRFYCDIYRGLINSAMYASTAPGVKGSGNTRLAFDVVIPDYLITEVDVVSPEPVVVTVLKDEPA